MKCLTNSCEACCRVLALGNFDGVHLAHQAVMEVAQTIAMVEGLRGAALSFLNHPRAVLEGKTPPLLTLPAEKALLASRCGLEEMILLPFDDELAEMEPEAFVRHILVGRCDAKHIVVGENYSFGKGGRGDIALLDRLSREMGFVLHVVPTMRVAGLEVSSTVIRERLLAGDVRTAAALLGRAYTIGGPIVHGRRIGRRMGFPTINIALPKGKLLPKFGVYFGYVTLGHDSQRHPAMFNLGFKPTVGSRTPTLEAYLLDFSGDIYGEAARISFVARIRDEKRFDSIDALAAQIEKDVALARKFY